MLRVCDRSIEPTPSQKDRLLRFGAIVRERLEQAGGAVALISRSGLDLGRFGVRYSHAGLSLKDSANTRWSVRQLYFACDEQRPRIFDQGVAGFVLGTDDPRLGYVSMVLLPPDEGAALARAALDDRLAIGLLGGQYSANAYPFALTYQNCNQWVAEMMATAWSRFDPAGGDPLPPPNAMRATAQRWLADNDYLPARFEATTPLLGLALAFVPWIHHDDHPPDERARDAWSISMPSALERFVRTRMPASRRIEFCHDDRQVVVREGWTPIDEGCRPAPGDTVISLEDR